MNEDKGQKPSISPDEYKGLIKQISLSSLAMERCEASLKREKFGQPLDVKIVDESEYRQLEDSSVEVLQQYKFVANKRKQREHIVSISCSYRLVYEISFPFRSDFFDIFLKINVPLNTWPYFREFVNSICNRMDIPKFILPLRK
ncbi:MAG: hypothetical protein M0017_08640 [Desulfobacteraceae bacterium]|nr:hypothetical protein [Desulfobacteraceae bacterium]